MGIGGKVAQAMLERGAELERLEQALEDAAAGRGTLVVIEAPAGLGKTALLEAAIDAAGARGAAVLSATCGELERGFPFGVCMQLLADPAMRSGGSAAAALSGGAGLAKPLFELERISNPEPDEDRLFALLHGLWWLTAGLAEQQPLLLAIDDAQWADEPSLRFIDFLGRRLDGLGVVVCLTVRTGEREQEPALEAIRCAAATEILRPQPLSGGAVGELVTAELGIDEPAAVRACTEATAGNPFYLGQLLASLRERDLADGEALAAQVRRSTPDSVTRQVHARIARLGAAALAMAEALSVLGDGAPVRRVAALAELDPTAAAEAAERLATADVLGDREPLAFAHPIVREVLYASLSEAARRHAHGRAAELLAGEGAQPEAIAAQLVRSDRLGREWAVDSLREAARRAASRGAHGAAIALLRRALEEPPTAGGRTAVLAELGGAELLAGDPACAEHLLAARAALGVGSPPELRAQIAGSLAQALIFTTRPSDAVQALQSAIGELAGEHPELASGLRAQLLGMGLLDQGTRRTLSGELGEAMSSRDSLDPATDAELIGVLALEATLGPWPGEIAQSLAERALGEGRLLAQVPPDHVAAVGSVAALQLTESAERVAEVLGEAQAAAERSGSVRALAVVACLRSRGAFRWVEVAEAEEEGRAALRLATEHGWPLGVPTAIACVADPLIERGELEEARGLTEVVEQVGELVETLLFQQARECRARLELASERPREALRLALACGAWERSWGATNSGFTHYPWRATAALAQLELGERAAAAELAAELLEAARSWGTARAIGIALRIGALSGPAEERVARLREAVAELAATPARLEHARALTDLGAALRADRQKREAREHLYAALDLARRCGATALTERIRAELRAAGARPRREASTGPEGLTPSERRVAELAASGLANRAIAQRLFLSQRTVETHLTSAYRKLEIDGREQVAAALGG